MYGRSITRKLLGVVVALRMIQRRIVVAQTASGDASAANEIGTQTDATTLDVDGQANGQGSSGSGKKKLISLLDAEPSSCNGIVRYPKYYGDASMVRGCSSDNRCDAGERGRIE
jgi:hypothetical protein